MTDFVTAWVRRFDTLAGLECDMTEIERLLFDLADDVRRDASAKHQSYEEVALRLEALAHDAEVAARDALEARDEFERLRYADVLLRGASLLCGTEKDQTPSPHR
jgi:hypothetical protein